MLVSKTTRRFREALAALPPTIQLKAQDAYDLFRGDPGHPSLHFKRVSTQLPIYSARVDLNYRVVGILRDDTIVWFWIGSHDEYAKLLANM